MESLAWFDLSIEILSKKDPRGKANAVVIVTALTRKGVDEESINQHHECTQ